MKSRYLGLSGMTVSEIAYGNWLTHASQIEEEVATSCVHAAFESGITTFDTADVYAGGQAEVVLGRALKKYRREEIEVLTKLYWPTGPGKNERGLSRKHIMNSIEASLRRLDMDYVDVYQAHRYDYFTPLEETITAFSDIVRSGKALYIGVSEWRAEEIRAACKLARELHVSLVSNQPQYSMLWRVIESEVAPACEELGLGQLAWSPLAQGVLTGKYLPQGEVPEKSRANDKMGGAQMINHWLREEVLNRVSRLAPLAHEAGMPLSRLAIAWVLQNSNVSAAIIGASTPEQIYENVKASDVTLEIDLLEAIDEVIEPVIERSPVRTSSPQNRP